MKCLCIDTSQAFIWSISLLLTSSHSVGIYHCILQDACQGYLSSILLVEILDIWLWYLRHKSSTKDKQHSQYKAPHGSTGSTWLYWATWLLICLLLCWFVYISWLGLISWYVRWSHTWKYTNKYYSEVWHFRYRRKISNQLSKWHVLVNIALISRKFFEFLEKAFPKNKIKFKPNWIFSCHEQLKKWQSHSVRLLVR